MRTVQHVCEVKGEQKWVSRPVVVFRRAAACTERCGWAAGCSTLGSPGRPGRHESDAKGREWRWQRQGGERQRVSVGCKQQPQKQGHPFSPRGECEGRCCAGRGCVSVLWFCVTPASLSRPEKLQHEENNEASFTQQHKKWHTLHVF